MQNYTPISVFETTNLFETFPQLFNFNFTVTDEFGDKPVSNHAPIVQVQLFSQMSLATNLVRLVVEGFLLPAVGCLGLVSYCMIDVWYKGLF